MNQDEVIEMARQAGMIQDGEMWFSSHVDIDVHTSNLEAFAKLVAAYERERCACECEKDAFVEQWKGLAEATKRIRARGEA